MDHQPAHCEPGMAELHAAICRPHSGSGDSTWANFGSDFGISGLPSRGQISDTNWFGLTQAITGPKAGANQYGARDVLNTTRGKHTLYLGGEAGLEKDFQQTSLNNYGVFAFTTAAGALTNYSLSNFIAG